MKLFYILVKKEIRELLTLQMLIPFLIMVAVFMVLGNVSRSEIEKSQQPQKLIIIDNDKSSESTKLVELLKVGAFIVSMDESHSIDDALQRAREQEARMVIIIPDNFNENLSQLKPATVETYSLMNSFSFGSSSQYALLASSMEGINQTISNELISQQIPSASVTELKNPIIPVDHVVIGDKKATITPSEILGYVTSQANFIPIIMFMVIVMSSQMIASAIAAEKENKTLETLLSTPVSRTMIVSSKMLGAGLVALLLAGAYMFGLQSYIDGISGGALSMASSDRLQSAISQLGLSLTSTDFLLIGGSLFGAILCALAISIILGSFAEDVKAVQGVTTPLMVFVLFSYFSSMFIDVYSAAPVLRYALLAIPFTHPFQAIPNIFLGRSDLVLFGVLYEIIVFTVFVIIAAKIFSSDKIFTLKIKMPKRN
ncbi:ABC transporter permease [candidate division WWE3 bacterium]|nr:ABC transporter permease [candidate division WWE3 bacterium]